MIGTFLKSVTYRSSNCFLSNNDEVLENCFNNLRNIVKIRYEKNANISFYKSLKKKAGTKEPIYFADSVHPQHSPLFASGIIREHAYKLRVMLQLLDAAISANQLNLPGLGFHKLKGKFKNFYAITVRANWRIIFQFKGEDAILVNYLDYH